jgi:hypothetical protein
MIAPLTRTKLLAVEGIDEVVFFEELLKHLDMIDSVDVRQVGGKDQFKIKMPVLQKSSGFNRLESVAIIRDADENTSGAFNSIKKILDKMHLPAPGKPGDFYNGTPRVGIFIMPDNTRKGMLETLCIDTVEDNDAMRCVDEFVRCSLDLKRKPRNIDKAKAHAFLSIMPDIANSLGRGAQKGYWNFNAPALKPLIAFLSQL